MRQSGEVRDESRIAEFARIDSFAYRHRVGDLMKHPPLTVGNDRPIGAALAAMMEKKVSSLFLPPETADGPDGIVTERDIMRAIDRAGPGGARRTGRKSRPAPAGDDSQGRIRLPRDRPDVGRRIPASRRRGRRRRAVRRAERAGPAAPAGRRRGRSGRQHRIGPVALRTGPGLVAADGGRPAPWRSRRSTRGLSPR